MSRIDRILFESDELKFVDPRTPKGKRILTLQGNHLRTGNEHLLVLDGDRLYCTIEKCNSGWTARFGLQEVSEVYPTLESCKDGIRKRRRSSRESLSIKEDSTPSADDVLQHAG